MKIRPIKHIFLTLILISSSTQVFASVFGVVDKGASVAYNTKEQKTYEIKKGEQLEVIDLQEEKDTYIVAIEGDEAEIAKNQVGIRKVILKMNENGIKVRKHPDPKADLITELSVGDVASILYQSDNWYYVILEDQSEGFIYKDQLEDKRLELLSEKEFAAKEVEVLSWSAASKVMPRGSVVTIQDVYTGKSFKVKRTFGTNHADVEALTKADTQMIKSIWGGFTWERRPVIVHINGRYLAASMAGMPHAGDSLNAISSNGMSGVLDLHFVGSKRHKEGNIQAVVDPQHQAAIKVAANYKIK